MAKIVVLSMAYRGDVHPYVPVASELAHRGHDVTFIVPREFHQEFEAEPFRCVHSGSDFAPSELNKHGAWLARWGMRFGGVRLLELYIGEFTVPHLEPMYDAVHRALDGADLLFCHSTAGIVGSMAAEKLDVPWISGDLFPMLIPTATASPAPNIPALGRRVNRMTWRIARSTRPNRLSYATEIAGFRRSLGLDARRRSMIDARISPHLNLGMVSPNYLAPAPDWPTNYELTGFTHWQNAETPLSADVATFLDAGEPALLVTLGTLAASVNPERFQLAIDAAAAAGLRTLSLCSTQLIADALSTRNDAAQHMAVPFAPLSQVLPHVRAVVHSGSHGTNSMTLAAGLPSIIVPSIFDQVWHARRQEELGTGIHVPKARNLGDALARLVGDPSMAARAKEFATALADEDGVTMTTDRIEDVLNAQVTATRCRE